MRGSVERSDSAADFAIHLLKRESDHAGTKGLLKFDDRPSGFEAVAERQKLIGFFQAPCEVHYFLFHRSKV